jgi:hypothetical protein
MLKTGNHKAERVVRGQSLVYLTTFCLVNPAASINKAGAYLRNMNPAGVPYGLAAVTGRASLGPEEKGILNDVSEDIPPPE